MKRKTLGTVVLAVTMATALVACSADPGTSQGDESAVSGGTIRVGLDIEVSSVDPIGNDIGQQSSLVLANAIYEPLLMDGPRGEFGGVWVFRTVCFERVVLSSPGCLWPGRMDDHEEVLEAHA